MLHLLTNAGAKPLIGDENADARAESMRLRAQCKVDTRPPAAELPLQLPDVESAPNVTVLHEPLFRVLLHNDDITPFDYVMTILGKVFMLSEELAEHIAIIAHSEGVSVVIIRHRSEAQRLCAVANRSARADGFPLTFTCEPDS